MPVIALVDDDRNILTSVSIALEGEGYRIMTYSDGVSALAGFSGPDHDNYRWRIRQFARRLLQYRSASRRRRPDAGRRAIAGKNNSWHPAL